MVKSYFDSIFVLRPLLNANLCEMVAEIKIHIFNISKLLY